MLSKQRAKTKEPRTKSQDKRTKNKEQRTKEPRAKSQESRQKNKEQRTKTKEQRENIKAIHPCTNAATRWLSVVEACSSLSKTRSLSVVEAGNKKTKEQRTKTKDKRQPTLSNNKIKYQKLTYNTKKIFSTTNPPLSPFLFP